MSKTGQRYNVNLYSVQFLLSLIEQDQIAIPEIQRPFVWTSTKVRDLLDSLYQGFPIGYLIGWKNPDIRLKDGTISSGKLILIDGQQRVTALMAALAGKEIVNRHYKKTRIRIAFHPIQRRFEVFNSAIAKNAAWIPDIAQVFAPTPGLYQIVDAYCSRNPDSSHQEVFESLSSLQSITGNHIGFIELSHDLDIDTVTEIFIRVNSAGVPLNQADFAMSKISVNEEHGGTALRKAIDYFCHLSVQPGFFETVKNDHDFVNSQYFSRVTWLKNENESLWDPSYTDMLRVAFTSEFHRGRLADLVALLSGRNFETRTYEDEIVEESFRKLSDGVMTFMSETRFKDLIMILKSAGFIDGDLIGSSNAISFAYILYHLLKKKQVVTSEIHRAVRRWFVMSLLTARHSGSFETRFEQDARAIMQSQNPLTYIEAVIEGALSDSFWNVVLPQRMVSSSGNNQFFHIYKAAQIRMGDKGFLSSDFSVKDLIENKSDVHHIFPKSYLQKNGYVQSQYNQISNYVIAQSEINIAISNREPKSYMQQVCEQLNNGPGRYGGITSEEQLLDNLRQNCIPEMIFTVTHDDYLEFLEQRRRLMATKIRQYFESF